MSGLADGEAGLCFCPSVNHPAWFAELQRGERRGVIIVVVIQEIVHGARRAAAAVVSDEMGQLRQGYDVRGARQLQSERVITHLAEKN